MECPYLSRNSLMATIGSQPPPGKHFTLRRKPKSAALKAELFQKGKVEVLKHNFYCVDKASNYLFAAKEIFFMF